MQLLYQTQQLALCILDFFIKLFFLQSNQYSGPELGLNLNSFGCNQNLKLFKLELGLQVTLHYCVGKAITVISRQSLSTFISQLSPILQQTQDCPFVCLFVRFCPPPLIWKWYEKDTFDRYKKVSPCQAITMQWQPRKCPYSFWAPLQCVPKVRPPWKLKGNGSSMTDIQTTLDPFNSFQAPLNPF